MRSDTIVAYTYRASMLCPGCIMAEFNSDGRLGDDVEAVLDWHAKMRGIDREDERSFDSGDFPKVVFADQVSDFERFEDAACMDCGEGLI